MTGTEGAPREETPATGTGHEPYRPPKPGARKGARRAAKPKRTFHPTWFALGAGALAALAVWGILVWIAIDAGRTARGGDSTQWGYLVAASCGAVIALFVSLWLAAALLRAAGILSDNTRTSK